MRTRLIPPKPSNNLGIAPTNTARRTALGRHPTIDLIDGEKLTELCLHQGIGTPRSPVVHEGFFDRLEGL